MIKGQPPRVHDILKYHKQIYPFSKWEIISKNLDQPSRNLYRCQMEFNYELGHAIWPIEVRLTEKERQKKFQEALNSNFDRIATARDIHNYKRIGYVYCVGLKPLELFQTTQPLLYRHNEQLDNQPIYYTSVFAAADDLVFKHLIIEQL